MGGLPSADAFFGQGQQSDAKALPTADEFFGPVNPPTPPKPQSGASWDAIWSSLQHSGTRILNAMGEGAADGWGSEPTLDETSSQWLRKVGIYNDFTSGHQSFVKSINEALIRPVISGADVLLRGPGAAVGAAAGGAEQVSEETGGTAEGGAPKPVGPVGKAASLAAGVAGEYLRDIQTGGIPELAGMGLRSGVPEVEGAAPLAQAPEQARAAVAEAAPTLAADVEEATQAQRVSDVTAARSYGVVGEGEEGFYGAEPVSPENMEARANAAEEAGLPPPQPEPPAPDVHTLARRIDPDTFQEFDALAAQRERYRSALGDLAADRENTPEAIEARTQIDTILGKVNGVEDRLTKAAAARLADVQARLDAALQADTPVMQWMRGQLMDADFRMRELAPQVSEAYRNAREMAPNLPETAAVQGPEGAAVEQSIAPDEVAPAAQETPEAPPTTTGTREGQAAEAAPGASPEARIAPVAAGEAQQSPELAPPQVTGEQPLGEAGSKPEPRPRYGAMRPVEGTGELQTRTLSEGVEAKAIEDGLTRTFGDLPEYRRVSMAEQAQAAAELIRNDYTRAKDIAMGRRTPPKGLLPESVFVAVEKEALAQGDVDTLAELATRSRLTTEATTMGQRIRTLAERDQASPVGAIQEVQKAREADLAERMDVEAAKRDTIQEIKTEMKRAASGHDAWADFIAAIKCGEG